MKKNPFLIEKKIIITDNETIAIKGGSDKTPPTTMTVSLVCTVVGCFSVIDTGLCDDNNE